MDRWTRTGRWICGWSYGIGIFLTCKMVWDCAHTVCVTRAMRNNLLGYRLAEAEECAHRGSWGIRSLLIVWVAWSLGHTVSTLVESQPGNHRARDSVADSSQVHSWVEHAGCLHQTCHWKPCRRTKKSPFLLHCLSTALYWQSLSSCPLQRRNV